MSWSFNHRMHFPISSRETSSIKANSKRFTMVVLRLARGILSRYLFVAPSPFFDSLYASMRTLVSKIKGFPSSMSCLVEIKSPILGQTLRLQSARAECQTCQHNHFLEP